MMLFAQLPGAGEAIKAAAEGGSYEAVLLVVLVLGIVSFFGFVLSKVLSDSQKREERYSERISKLEDQVRQELMAQLRLNTEAMTKVIDAADSMVDAVNKIMERMDHYDATLQARPCLLAVQEQAKLLAIKNKE